MLHTISYTRHFLTGVLAGMSVPVSYRVDRELCCRDMSFLNDLTEDNPGTECLTGVRYYVTNVRCLDTEAK